MHKEHSETFYILSGKMKFILDDRVEVLTAGDTLHVPRGVPHQPSCIENGRMLTISEPGGLEELFEAYINMSPEDAANQEKVDEVEAAFDHIKL